ncbi:MAG: hypothetical protein AB1659_08935, partial [Thermodesulfobacteriota bacterium]
MTKNFKITNSYGYLKKGDFQINPAGFINSLKECHYLKPVGIADFAEPAASSGTGHTPVLPGTLFLASSATSTIAQFRFYLN